MIFTLQTARRLLVSVGESGWHLPLNAPPEPEAAGPVSDRHCTAWQPASRSAVIGTFPGGTGVYLLEVRLATSQLT